MVSREVLQKRRFDVDWIQTNQKTSKQQTAGPNWLTFFRVLMGNINIG